MSKIDLSRDSSKFVLKAHCYPMMYKFRIMEINTQKGQLRGLEWLFLGSSTGRRMTTDHWFLLMAF